MKPLFILCLTLSASLCYSQKHERSESHPWLMDSSLYLTDSTAASSVIYKDEKYGVAFFDENGTVSAELPIPGRIIGLSKWKGNVLTFYVDQYDRFKLIKNIPAILIDAKTKTIRQDQPIFATPGKNFIVCQVKNDDQGNFGCLQIRTTFMEGNYNDNTSKNQGRRNGTTGLTAMYLSDDFQPIARSLSTAAVNTIFVASYANRKGELAVLSYWNDQIVAEKFGRDGQLQKKATVSFPGFKDVWIADLNNWSRGAFRQDNDDILAFSVIYGVFVVDFGAEKAWALETPGLKDKAYNDRLAQSPEVMKARNFKFMGSFKPDCLFFNGDTLIFSKEIQYWEQPLNNYRYIGAGTMVTVYDGQFRWVHQFYPDRYYESFSDGGFGWSYHVKNGKLLAYANAITRAEHYENICYVMDLHSFTMEQKTMDWGDIGHGDWSLVANVFWFRDNLLKDPSTAGGFARHFESALVKMAYP